MIRAETSVTLTRLNNGASGKSGKSAYEAAVLAGYTGTEEQFNSDLAGVSNKVDIEIAEDLETEVYGGDKVICIAGQGSSFSSDEISIRSDTYKRMSEIGMTLTFNGTAWIAGDAFPGNTIYPSDNSFPNSLAIQLDDLGISLDESVTPVEGDTIICAFTELNGLKHRTEQVEGNIDILRSNYDAMSDDVKKTIAEQEKRNKHIIIDESVPSITLHAETEDSENEVVITDEKISFQENGNEAAYISDDALLVTNEFITNYYPRAKNDQNEWVGNLAWIARVNGHLSLKRVEGGIS